MRAEASEQRRRQVAFAGVGQHRKDGRSLRRRLRDLREQVGLTVRLGRARGAAGGRLQLLCALPHCRSLLVGELLAEQRLVEPDRAVLGVEREAAEQSADFLPEGDARHGLIGSVAGELAFRAGG